MIRRPRWNRKRWLALGAWVLIIGAAGCETSEDSERAASENDSTESQRPAPLPQEEPQLTFRQETALVAARYRINLGGLSKRALIQHMTADGLPLADAAFAADNVGADWREEAVEQARGRLGADAYSRKSLLEHLWKADGFTRAQAEYAVDKVND